MARIGWIDSLVGTVVNVGLCAIGVAAYASEAVMPGVQTALAVTGSAALSGLEIADKHLTAGVKELVGYLDDRPGLAAVVSLVPLPVFRRMVYRQTDETINQHRAQSSEPSLHEGEGI